MLVARRDPPFHGDARDIAPVNFEANPGSKPPRVVRFVTVIQMVGSLLAVPVGIGSAYTFYRANFSPETTCQSLRNGIIAMLDKGVDASTRRILVRRDVESFEKTCAAVDPEATAAFKALLAAEKSPPVAAAAPATKAQPNDAAPKEPVHKAEPRPQATPKQAATNTNTQTPAAQNARRDPAVSDTQWLDAVRQALVTHQPDARPAESSKARPMPQPSARPAQRDAEPSAPPAAAAFRQCSSNRTSRDCDSGTRCCADFAAASRHRSGTRAAECGAAPGSRSPGSTRIDPIFRNGCQHGNQDRSVRSLADRQMDISDSVARTGGG